MVDRIREVLNEHTLPVILMSSADEEGAGGAADGCNDYLSKPVKPDELVARIRTQMRLRRVFRLNEEACPRTTAPRMRQFAPQCCVYSQSPDCVPCGGWRATLRIRFAPAARGCAGAPRLRSWRSCEPCARGAP